MTSEIAKRSSVIHLTCEASSPELAQTILKVFLAAFQSQHVQAHRTDQSLPFFEGQAELLRRELEQATKQLVSAKNEAGVVSLEVRRQATEDDLTQLGRQVQESRAQLTALEATLKNLQEQSQELPQLQTAEEIYGQPDDVIGTTRRTLYDLQIRERDLLTRYTPRHPLVNATRQQITQAELLLAGTSSTPLAETKRIPNPAWQQVRLQLLTTETEAAAVRGKAEKLEQQLASLKADRKQLNQLDGHIRQLQQQVDVLQASYGAYLDRREQARVVRALERERISNVNVIQPASYVSQPIAPKRGLILVLCVFVSACAGIGLALMVAAFSLPHEHREEPRGVLASNDRPESNEGCDHEIENTAKLVAAARY